MTPEMGSPLGKGTSIGQPRDRLVIGIQPPMEIVRDTLEWLARLLVFGRAARGRLG